MAEAPRHEDPPIARLVHESGIRESLQGDCNELGHTRGNIERHRVHRHIHTRGLWDAHSVHFKGSNICDGSQNYEGARKVPDRDGRQI